MSKKKVTPIGTVTHKSRIIHGSRDRAFQWTYQTGEGAPVHNQGYHPFEGLLETFDSNKVSRKNTAITHLRDGMKYLSFDFVDWHGVEYLEEPQLLAPRTYVGPSLAEAIKVITPKLASEFSVLNFIWELKDFKSLIPSIADNRDKLISIMSAFPGVFGKKARASQIKRKLIKQKREKEKYLERLRKGYKPEPKSLKRDSISEAIRKNDSKLAEITRLAAEIASDGLLIDSFAIEPFIGDLQKLFSGYQEFSLKLFDFMKKDGLTQKRRVKKLIPGLNRLQEDPNSTWNSYFYLSREDEIGDTQVVWNIWYRYNVPEILPEIPEILRGYFGIRPDARIVWNAIPWSFVFDWLVDINKFLEQFDPGAIPIDLEIIEATCSWKGRDLVRVHHKAKAGWNDANPTNQVPETTLGYIGFREYYVRNVIIDKDTLLKAQKQIIPPDMGDPTGKQALLSLALLVQLSK